MRSSDPAHGHDPRYELARVESLSLLALGEQIDADLDGHIDECPDCQAELAALRRTVALGRYGVENDNDLPTTPSPAVWERITAELGAPAGSAHHSGRQPASDERRSWRYWVGVAAAAVVIAAAGTGGGYLAGRNVTPSVPPVTATAQLSQMPGGPSGVGGSAKVHKTATGPQVSVQATNLPERDGYYEVWLYNPDTESMVAIGTLPRDGAASFPVPPGLDVDAYHVVDVSAQDYDGDPTHKQSVLRGALSQ